MRARRGTGDHRRLAGLDDHSLHLRPSGAQRFGDADEAPADSDVDACRIDRTLELVENLLADQPIPVERIAIVELIGRKGTLRFDDLAHPLAHCRDQPRMDAGRAVDDLQRRSEGGHVSQLLRRERVRRDDAQRVPLDRAHKRSELPVEPPVYSTTVWPGASVPRRSAASIIASAIRSLYEPVGLAASSLIQMSACSLVGRVDSLISGVPPMAASAPGRISITPLPGSYEPSITHLRAMVRSARWPGDQSSRSR